MSTTNIGVLGGGAWGMALASVLGNTVLCTRTTEQADILRSSRKSDNLPGCVIPDSVHITAEPAHLSGVDMLLMVCPVNATRAALETLDLPTGIPVLHCAKGLERGTQLMMSDVGQEVLPDNPHGVLSGPSFAVDVVQGKPTAVTIACQETTLARHLQQVLHRQSFRPYASTDVTGVQLGGALKNVIAIATGICVGQDLGESARAGLIARGFSEMQRLGIAMGGQPETFAGLSGLGDLVLTCGSSQSRNFAYGLAIGSGLTPDSAKLAEGASSARVVTQLAGKMGVDVPVSRAVADILEEKVSIQQAVLQLLQRPLREE